MKNKSYMEYILFGIFAVVGAITIVMGIASIISGMRFKETAVEITGVISEIDSYRDSDGDRHYSVFVNYSYNGSEYTDVRLGEYNSSMYEGKEIALLVNPDSPRDVRTTNGDIIGSIMMIPMGLIFLLVGVIPMKIMLKKAAKKKALIEQGHCIYAIVDNIDINRGYSKNGKHPYVIYCSHQDEYTGVTYRFKSENLWTNPAPYIQQRTQLRVYVNGQDYSQYHVDVESAIQGRIVDYT